jgi:hypothetical protein
MLYLLVQLALLMAFPRAAMAQSTDTTHVSPLAISGYAEVYFSYDLSAPRNGERPAFLYNHRRHNEVALNLGFIKAGYNRQNVRANLALMAGTYPQYNLAAEPVELRSMMEANVGVRLSATKDLWLDAGMLPSHIGAESAIGADCLTLTRSIWAENTPYFETGVRLTYKPVPHVALAALYLNGWQRMQRPAGYSAPCFGTQVNVTTTSGVQWNWSTFVGSTTPDSVGLWRFYNNVYLVASNDTTGLTLGFDLGLQQTATGGVSGWFGPLAMVRQRLGRGWWWVTRLEFFNDEDRVILPTSRPIISASVGADKRITGAVLWRIETRWMGNDDAAFMDSNGRAAIDNWAFTTALTAKF